MRDELSAALGVDRSAIRAIQKCDMRGLAVPSGKYETWSEVIVNFDPTDMFF